MVSFGRERVTESPIQSTVLAPYVVNNVPDVNVSATHSFRSRVKLTRDCIHPNYPKEGGPLDIQESHITFRDVVAPRGGAEQWGYFTGQETGLVRCTHALPASLERPLSAFAECESLGPTAWNRFRPAKPTVELGVFIAELRDLPGLMFSKLNKFRNIGKNYLAYQFGWRPFLSDLRHWYESIINLDQQIAQLMRDNGRWIRRGGVVFENEDSDTDGFGRELWYALWPNHYVRSVQTDVVTKTYERAWFSAAFRYYIPGLTPSKFGKAKAILKLWNLDIGPEQLWELIPFSWLVDWFSNVGDVVGNYAASVQDNLVAKYAYVMQNKRQTLSVCTMGEAELYRDKGTYPRHYWERTFTPFVGPSYELVSETKTRAVASPFGFGFTFDTLSLYQLSILTALGISKLKV